MPRNDSWLDWGRKPKKPLRKPKPCVLCNRKRCHRCRSDEVEDGYFWLPFCMGGAIDGGSNGCTCWPETPRQRAARLASMEKEAARSFRLRMVEAAAFRGRELLAGAAHPRMTPEQVRAYVESGRGFVAENPLRVLRGDESIA